MHCAFEDSEDSGNFNKPEDSMIQRKSLRRRAIKHPPDFGAGIRGRDIPLSFSVAVGCSQHLALSGLRVNSSVGLSRLPSYCDGLALLIASRDQCIIASTQLL